MKDPMNTIPMASPAVRPLARLLEPSDHADELTAAAILFDISIVLFLRAKN
jgi:hypothetical protein